MKSTKTKKPVKAETTKVTKSAKKLAARIARWEGMPSSGADGNTKYINGYAYRKPGSQNVRQGN